MKTFKRLFLAIVLILFLTGSAMAAGSATVSNYQKVDVLQGKGIGQYQRIIVTISFTCDSGGTWNVPATTINATTYGLLGYWLVGLETYSATATVTYVTTISTVLGNTLLTATGSSLTNYTNVNFVTGNLTFAVSGNSVPSATGTVILTFTAL